MSNQRRVKEHENQKTAITKQFLTSSAVEVAKNFSVPSSKTLLELTGQVLSVCIPRRLIAVLMCDPKQQPHGPQIVLFSYSESHEGDFVFEVVQCFEKETEIFIFYTFSFSPNSRYLFCAGESTLDTDLHVIDFEEERKEEEQEQEEEENSRKQKKNKKYEMKSHKLDLGNEQLFQYMLGGVCDVDSSVVAFSVYSGDLTGKNASGVFVMNLTSPNSFDRVAYFDLATEELRKKGDLRDFCTSLCFCPRSNINNNLLVFGNGNKAKVVDVRTQEEVVVFQVEKVATGSCSVAWPSTDTIVYGAQDVVYIARVSQKSIVEKVAVPDSCLNAQIQVVFEYPFRSSSIVGIVLCQYGNKSMNFLFLDTGSVSSSSSCSSSSSAARIVHQIDVGKKQIVKEGELDEVEKKMEQDENKKYFWPYQSSFLSPSAFLSTGICYLPHFLSNAEPATLCFNKLPVFSWPARRKIWLVREKGNEKNVAIVRVLKEIYNVCQVVCLFA